MRSKMEFKGVIPAVVTPLTNDDRPDLKNLQTLIQTLKEEGVDGILLLGTTGEGPSMSFGEREDIVSAGLDAAKGIFVLVGTGCVSLKETIQATKRAFELGADGVVTLPPYYYKKISNNGLFTYFERVFDEAVPKGKYLFLYDIPQMTNVPIPLEVIERLAEKFDDRFAGIKDSTGDYAHSETLCRHFPSLRIFVGTDKLLLNGMKNGAAGCITAGANVFAPLAMRTYQAYLQGDEAELFQEELTMARSVLEGFTPFAPSLKYLLGCRFGSLGWFVRSPLVSLMPSEGQKLTEALKALPISQKIKWLN